MRLTAAFRTLLLCCLGSACHDATPVEKRLVPGAAPYPFAVVEDNLKHDTLLIQVTYDLGDGSYLMVASNVEETFEGLRLVRYALLPDSQAERLATSSPGYDSWTMLPTFFALDSLRPADGLWVLANFGERESWGQKLMLLDVEFSDHGFLDVALPERVDEGDGPVLKRRDIGPFIRYEEIGDTAVFRFDRDSVFLYDDQAGRFDQVIAADRLRYTYHREEGLALWLDGAKRLVKKPS